MSCLDLIVIFDGHCGLCNTLRRQIKARDVDTRLYFVPYQSADLGIVAPGISRDMASRSVWALCPDGHRWKGARAIFETLRCLPGTWGWIGAVGALPPVSLLVEPFYRLVAHHRAIISRWLGLNQCAPDLPFNEEVAHER